MIPKSLRAFLKDAFHLTCFEVECSGGLCGISKWCDFSVCMDTFSQGSEFSECKQILGVSEHHLFYS
jgi:hypothetical protein